jgi:hypothetical protein
LVRMVRMVRSRCMEKAPCKPRSNKSKKHPFSLDRKSYNRQDLGWYREVAICRRNNDRKKRHTPSIVSSNTQ